MSLDKHRQAGEIVTAAKAEARGMVEPGASGLAVAEAVEDLIADRGGEPAFPCNVSVNEVAAHYTPSRDDELLFEDGDLVKLDIGAHVDGYIADSAFTVSLGGDDELVEAAEAGLSAGVETVRAGVDTAEVGGAIESAIRERGVNPVVNLTGHGLERYVQHAEPSIPNVGNGRGATLEEGQVVAIEPFTTRGQGRVTEAGDGEIYRLEQEDASARSRRARDVLEKVKRFHGLPFAARWLDGGAGLGLKMLVKSDAVRNYPVLKEVTGEPIAQAEDTVIVQEGGAEVITA